MLFRSIGYFLISTTLTLCAVKEQLKEIVSNNEIDVINDIIDSLYTIEYCHGPLPPPYYKDSPKYKRKYQEYKEKLRGFHQELDSLEKIVFVFDTLSEIDVSHIKDWYDSTDTVFNQFYSFSIKKVGQRHFDTDSLYQKNIIFKSDIKYRPAPWKGYGRYQNQFFICSLSFSRVLFNDDQNLGIVYYEYFCKGDVAYGRFALIKREGERWIIHKILSIWIA